MHRCLFFVLFSAALLAQSGAPCPIANKWSIYPVDPVNGGDLLQCTLINGRLVWQPVNVSSLPLPASALPSSGAITINKKRLVVGGNYTLKLSDLFPVGSPAVVPAKTPQK